VTERRDDLPRLPGEFERSGAVTIPTEDVFTCAVCGSDRYRAGAAGYDYELRTCRNLWQFVHCLECDQLRLHPRPSLASLPIIYPPTYYAYQYDRIPPLVRYAKRRMDAGKLGGILRVLERPVTNFLDVGCGDGRYLDDLAARGVPRNQLCGLELDQRVVAGLVDRGYQAWCERVESCDRFAERSLDLITMFHVIEHLDAPDKVVERLASWLRPGGVLALETPNVDSLDARLFADGRWGGFHIPRHWHLFTPETISRLLTRFGLEVIDVRFQTGHSFWLYSFHHALRYRDRPLPRLARFFDPLRSVAALASFTLFDKLRAALGARTSGMLVLARRR
jgi:SAM-dependent methyltransferase